MAITAKFEADFTQFKGEVDRATTSLKTLETGAQSSMQGVAAATSQAESATSGWASALSSVTGLLGALGIAASLQGLIRFGQELLATADALVKLHDKTGISIEGLQQMQVAGDDAGVTLDTMADGVTKLQMRLGTGNAAANGALQELGINVEDFLKLDPAGQFIEIADAMRELKDPLEFARVGSELFGKQWAELAPVIKRGFDDVKDGAVGMSRETVTALDNAGDAMGRFWRATKAAFGEALADVLTLSLSKTRELQSEFSAMGEAAERNKPKIAGLVPPGLPADLEEIYAKFKEDAEGLRLMAEANDVANEAARDLGKAWAETDKIIDDFEKKTHALAMANEREIRAERQKTLTARNDSVLQGLAAIQKMEADNADFIAKQTLSTTDYQIRKINEWEQATIAAFKGTEEQLAAFTEQVKIHAEQQKQALIQPAEAMVTIIGHSAAELEAARQAGAKQTGDVVANEYRRQQEAFMSFKGIVVAGTHDMIGASESLVNSMTKVIDNAGDWLEREFQMQQAQRDRGEFFNPGMGGGMPTGHRASGGPVTAGSPYVVGERGPELFVPFTSGFISPNGGGMTVSNTFHIVDTEANIARRVSDEITRSIKSSTKWGAA
jgi:hypothetical protein